MANTGNDIVLPPEYAGPAQLLLYTRYGDPREAGFEHKWITSWNVIDTFPWLGKERLQVHKHFWPLLQAAFTELEVYGLNNEIKSIEACYDVRTVGDGKQLLSMHSWGAAIDMNTNVNAKWSDDFIAIMEKHHIHCGQTWHENPEPCHFAMVNG